MKKARGVALAAIVTACVFAGVGRAQPAVALTAGNSLFTFNVATPATTGTAVAITGLGMGESVVGLDYRPVNRTLVGVTNLNRLVVLNPTTGVATALSTLSVPLAGTAFGVDFNPVPDRLRIVSNTGQNLRVNVDTGAVTVDGALAYGATDANAGSPPQIGAAGYTNSIAGRIAVSTTLFDIDFAKDILVKQDPPNNGTLVTVGALGVDFNAASGFDIFSPTTAYASVGGTGDFYSVSLVTGAATLIGKFPANLDVVDFSLEPKEPALGLTTVSARGLVSPGEGAVISGFIVSGLAPVNVLINARGPSLAAFGVANALADTRVQIYRAGTLLDQNDDWQSHARSAEILASGLAPGSAKESSVLITLTPGVYTTVLTGAGTATTGVGIVEIYEL